MRKTKEQRIVLSVPKAHCIDVKIIDAVGITRQERIWIEEQISCPSSKIRREIEANAYHLPLGRHEVFIHYRPPEMSKYVKLEYLNI